MHRPRSSTIAIALILAITITFAMSCKDRTPRSVKGKGADFILEDLSGNEVSLKDFRGKVVMLEFWATWCPPCRASVPELIDLHERFQGRDFALIAISLDNSKSAVKDFVDEFNIPYIMLMNDGGVDEQYGVFSIPTSFIVGRDGKVVSKHAGYGEGMIDGIIEDIEELLAEPVQPEVPAAPSEKQPPEKEQSPEKDQPVEEQQPTEKSQE